MRPRLDDQRLFGRHTPRAVQRLARGRTAIVNETAQGSSPSSYSALVPALRMVITGLNRHEPVAVTSVDVDLSTRTAVISSEGRAIVEAHWQELSVRRPHLWRGPLLSVDHGRVGHGSAHLTLAHTDFAHYQAARQDLLTPADAPCVLYASALLITVDQHLVLVRMSSTTSVPGRVQLPGGNVDEADLVGGGLQALVAAARREVREEIGLTDDLKPDRQALLFLGAHDVAVLVPLFAAISSTDLADVFHHRDEESELDQVLTLPLHQPWSPPSSWASSSHPYLPAAVPYAASRATT